MGVTMIGTENCDSDWGREILEDFVASGGFAKRESLANAHTNSLTSSSRQFEP